MLLEVTRGCRGLVFGESMIYLGASQGENLGATQSGRKLLDDSNHKDHQSRGDVRNGVRNDAHAHPG